MPAYQEVLKLLAAGFGMGWGPCLAFWGPVLLPYIAATEGNWQGGLKTSALFACGRILALAILGGVAPMAFASINRLFPPHRAGYLYLGLGALIILMGILIIVGRGFRLPVHRLFRKYFLDGHRATVLFIGFLIGISPCAALVAILTYIAYTANSVTSGMVYAVSFALGTAVPVILLGTASSLFVQLGSLFVQRLSKLRRYLGIFLGVLRVLSGLVLVYFGVHIILDVIRWL